MAARELPIGDYRDSVIRMVNSYKQMVLKDYIYENPRSGYAYYALFQRINGTLLFDPESSRDDVRAFRAVATQWDHFYPHSLRTVNLHNITLRGVKNTRPQVGAPIPEELIRENIFRTYRLPMRETLRCLNLSNAVAIVTYEVLRSWDFEGLV